MGPTIRGELSIAAKWQSVIGPDDIMQVTYVEAFLRVRQFSGSEPAKFLAWLRQIARNNLLDAIRGLECDKRPPPGKRVAAPDTDQSYVDLCAVFGVTSQTPSRVVGGDEARSLVQQALRRLPPDYEWVIRLFDLEGRSGPEVAEAMNRSRGAVFMLLARARERLRVLLGPESQFFSRGA
jgi:RNA polymerase sigma-70 factor (ECF subfamily)